MNHNPHIPSTRNVRRLGNDDTVQECTKMTYGPDGDDSTKEDKDATELAMLVYNFPATLWDANRAADCIRTGQ